MSDEPSLRESPEVVEILTAAYNLVRQGWAQKRYYDGEEPRRYCLVGAVENAAVPIVGPMHPQKWVALNYLSGVIRPRWGGALESWNDEPRRTKRQVLAAIRKAIKCAASESARKDGSSQKKAQPDVD